MDETLKLLIAAGQTLLPQIVPGAAPAIQMGKGIIDALDAAKDLVTPGDQAVYGETRDALRARILEHFDDTIAALRGDD